jgi:thioredoxin
MSVTHFEQKVAKGLVLVDFGARWCPPCKKLQPILEELSHQEAASLRLLQVDVDENETLTKAKSIEVLPVLLLYKDGKQVWRHEGFADKQAILAQIQKYR